MDGAVRLLSLLCCGWAVREVLLRGSLLEAWRARRQARGGYLAAVLRCRRCAAPWCCAAAVVLRDYADHGPGPLLPDGPFSLYSLAQVLAWLLQTVATTGALTGGCYLLDAWLRHKRRTP